MNTSRLNIMLLKTQGSNNQIKEKIRKYLEINDNENTLPNRYTAKVVLRGKFMARQVFLKKKKKKISYKPPNLLPKRNRKNKTKQKKKQNKTQSQQKEGTKNQRGNKIEI